MEEVCGRNKIARVLLVGRIDPLPHSLILEVVWAHLKLAMTTKGKAVTC